MDARLKRTNAGSLLAIVATLLLAASPNAGQMLGLAGNGNPIIPIVFIVALCWLAVEATLRRKRQTP